MSKFASTIKANVIRLMAESSLTLSELSRRTGIAVGNLHNSLHGERELQTDTIQKLADALSVEASELASEHVHAAH